MLFARKIVRAKLTKVFRETGAVVVERAALELLRSGAEDLLVLDCARLKSLRCPAVVAEGMRWYDLWI